MDDEADLEAEIQKEIEDEELVKKTEDRRRRLIEVKFYYKTVGKN